MLSYPMEFVYEHVGDSNPFEFNCLLIDSMKLHQELEYRTLTKTVGNEKPISKTKLLGKHTQFNWDMAQYLIYVYELWTVFFGAITQVITCHHFLFSSSSSFLQCVHCTHWKAHFINEFMRI